MSRKRCPGCDRLRDSVLDSEAFPRCKKERLCQRVDPALVRRYPNLTVEEYEGKARAIQVGHVHAEAWLKDRGFPLPGRDFLVVLLEAHRLIFAQADPLIAGRLRTTDVYFGGDGANRRQGAPPDRLQALLLCFDILPPPPAKWPAALWGASFLRRLFKIHPFADGNGRTARLVMTAGIEQCGVLAVSGHKRKNRKYLSALEYAHRHAEDPKPWINCHLHLARYLEEQIEEVDPIIEEEAPDPSGP